ncbi:MAG: dipicolinate synthase subunit B [Clostridia bacterium]|nr:dipicolinate synthase subunit B [Clostridia bacterium]
MENINIGFAMCGSFCTFSKSIPQLELLVEKGFNVYPIMSETAYSTDTRFGAAQYFIDKIESLTNKKIINSIYYAEPIGPKKLLDILVVAPCTGNTLAKISYGIADSSVTMAVKSHLRNQKPVLLAVSTNDALGNAAKNIGSLMNFKNVYFVPMGQDDYVNKPNSIVADFDSIYPAMMSALEGKQHQPLILSPKKSDQT